MLYFESELVLKFYNLEAWTTVGFFLVDDGERGEDPNTNKSGPSLTCLQNAIKMAWR